MLLFSEVGNAGALLNVVFLCKVSAYLYLFWTGGGCVTCFRAFDLRYTRSQWYLLVSAKYSSLLGNGLTRVRLAIIDNVVKQDGVNQSEEKIWTVGQIIPVNVRLETRESGQCNTRARVFVLCQVPTYFKNVFVSMKIKITNRYGFNCQKTRLSNHGVIMGISGLSCHGSQKLCLTRWTNQTTIEVYVADATFTVKHYSGRVF